MKAMVVLGTRPEIIKMAPVIRELQLRRQKMILVHTGQHYSYEMDRTFFKTFDLPPADFNLNVGSGSHAEQTGRILTRLEPILLKLRPDVLLVEGDTNSVLAGALAAAKCLVPVGHVEAGLRSFDRGMPEEINRIVADRLSAFLYPPTPVAARQLRAEGFSPKKMLVTGNTVVDSLYWLVKHPKIEGAFRKFRVPPHKFLLMTMHRAENVDHAGRLAKIVEGLTRVAKHFGVPILFPVHPRTEANLRKFHLHKKICRFARLYKPMDALPFMALQSHALLILTDSGGVQEESCILRVPCVTLRDNTERPETLTVGANLLAGADPARILSAAVQMAKKPRRWKNPFGDGHAGRRIVSHLLENFRRAPYDTRT